MFKKKSFVFILIFLQLSSLSFGCDTKGEVILKEGKITRLKKSIYRATKKINMKTQNFSSQAIINRTSLTFLPADINLEILKFIDLKSLISLKHSCKYFNDLIDDKIVYEKIPLKIINFFPDNTCFSDIILGHSLFNEGVKYSRKKNIKKAALLGHKEAISWINYQYKQRLIANDSYPFAAGFCVAWGYASIPTPVSRVSYPY